MPLWNRISFCLSDLLIELALPAVRISPLLGLPPHPLARLLSDAWGFLGRLKTEMFYPRDWQTASIEQFTRALDSYIRRYNEKRIKISLGALSPLDYRKSLGSRITSPRFLPHLFLSFGCAPYNAHDSGPPEAGVCNECKETTRHW
jgi:hypothetical protein